MGYLICDKCEGYYELQPGESPENFDLICNCGGELKLHNNIDIYYGENAEPKRESISAGRSYAEKKISHYNTIYIIGAIIFLVGLIGFFITPLSMIILAIGVGLIFYAHNEAKNWNKGIKGERIVAEYLEKQLPMDFIIFNDVKFPGSYGNLDHVVVGPNGVFVIETKNLFGFFVIDNKEWLFKKHSSLNVPLKRYITQPGKQVLTNAKDLNKFLNFNSFNLNDLWVYPIVTLIENNYKIKNKPKHYDVVNLTSIPEFIINKKKQFDPKILNEIGLLIKPYCNELAYGQSQKNRTYNKTYDRQIVDIKGEMIKNDEYQNVVHVNNNSKLSNNGIRKKSIVTRYLRQLPNSYFIFNNVKIPGSNGNLDHIVIGPKGIFVIETKNCNGSYIVRGENWYYETRKSLKRASSQPGEQVRRNARSLRKFLTDNDINMESTRIESIVTLVNNNFNIERKPTNYNVLYPAYITDFIQFSDRKIDMKIINEAALLIKHIL